MEEKKWHIITKNGELLVGNNKSVRGDFDVEKIDGGKNDQTKPTEPSVVADNSFIFDRRLRDVDQKDLKEIDKAKYLAILERYHIDPDLDAEPDEELIAALFMIEQQRKKAIAKNDFDEVKRLQAEQDDINLAMLYADKLLIAAGILD